MYQPRTRPLRFRQMEDRIDAPRHVLLIGALEGGLSRVAPMLQRAEFDVHTVEPSEFVLDLVLGTSFELLILGYPMPEMDISHLVQAVRDPDSVTRSAGLLLLAEPGFLEAAQGLVSAGANRVLAGILLSNRVVHDAANGTKEHRAMGATLAALFARAYLRLTQSGANTRSFRAREPQNPLDFQAPESPHVVREIDTGGPGEKKHAC